LGPIPNPQSPYNILNKFNFLFFLLFKDYIKRKILKNKFI